MYSKHVFALIVGVFVAVLPFSFPYTYAQNSTAALVEQVKKLQEELGQLQKTQPYTQNCLDVSHNLYSGVSDATTGGEVSKLQTFLATDVAVYPSGKITGFFGPMTEIAVQKWQSAHGIVTTGSPHATGYGVVGQKTRAALSCKEHTVSIKPQASVMSGGSNQQTFQLNGEQSELQGTTTGSKVVPAIGPEGTMVVRGTGAVEFLPAQTGNGVRFLQGSQQNANTAFYRFTGSSIGSIFASTEGEIQFSLKSSYSFEERKKLSRWNNRITFVVSDASKTQFSFMSQTNDGGNLVFYYTVNGAEQYYFVPKGTEDTVFGKNVIARVKIAWKDGQYAFYINDTSVKTGSYNVNTPNWTETSAFHIGASTNYNGGYFSSDDVIDDFKVFSQTASVSMPTPVQTPTTPVVPPTTPAPTNNQTPAKGVGVVGTTTPTVGNPVVVAPQAPTKVENYTLVIPAYNKDLDAVQAPTGFGTGKLWKVGPSRQYKKPSDVVKLVGDGDVVEIDAATYKCDDSVKWTANFLTLVGVGGRPVLDSTGCAISGGKGIWNPMSVVNSMIINNIEFMGAKVSDMNGAGIRYDGKGYVYITNSSFHNNENGILFTPGSSADVVIDHSEFAQNGAGDGYSHNMYISGKTNSFVLRYSYTHDAHIGHEVKSRALINYILYNRIATEANGDSSYNIDIPQGGLTYIIGNIIQQGKNSPNYGIISYSAEGTHNPVQKFYLAYNTIVNEGIAPNAASVVKITDNGLADAQMANNLVVGINQANMVGGAVAKMTLTNNIVTATPNFYDQANRIYYLKSTSPAVNVGTEFGTNYTPSLVPKYQFDYPANGVVRTKIGGTYDVGGYEYDSGKVVTPAPTVTLTTSKTSVDYNTSATLTWSSTNASTCTAGGGWTGALEVKGSKTTVPLTAKQTYTITCSGLGGTVSQSVFVLVNDSPEAVAMGVYVWKEVANSQINTVSAAKLKDATGKYTYANNFGTGPYTESKGNAATGVYVPETKTWYLVGGGGGRNYYGNEIYALNLATMKAERVTEPTDIGTTKEYAPQDTYGSKIHMTGCNGILNLNAGGIAPAPRGVVGTASYNPLTKKIVIGPSGIVRGIGNCTGSAAGERATDIWSFDPVTKKWTLMAKEDDRFGSVTVGTWFMDPATGIAYSAGNRNGSTRGGYLINTSNTQATGMIDSVKDVSLVDNTWPFMASDGPIAIDTTNHYAMQIGLFNTSPSGIKTPTVATFNLNGLSLTKYGTGGKKGTTGVVGGQAPLYEPDTNWTVTGETSVLDMKDVALTYNSKLQKFVAWAGGDTLYFLTLNYETKTLNILSKHVYGNPTSSVGVSYKFSYIPEYDAYVGFVGTEKNFFLLTPPTSTIK